MEGEGVKVIEGRGGWAEWKVLHYRMQIICNSPCCLPLTFIHTKLQTDKQTHTYIHLITHTHKCKLHTHKELLQCNVYKQNVNKQYVYKSKYMLAQNFKEICDTIYAWRIFIVIAMDIEYGQYQDYMKKKMCR